MVRPTKELNPIPFRRYGIFGWDPGAAVPDPGDPPVDRVIDSVVEMANPVSVAFVQEAIDTVGVADSPASVTLGASPTEGNLLMAFWSARGTAAVAPTGGQLPSGWTKAGPDFESTSFDGGIGALYYKFADPGESATVSFTNPGQIARLYVAEFSGAGGFDVVDTDDAVAATTSLASGPLAAAEGVDLIVIAAFVQAARTATYTWGSGYTELDEANLDASGPSSTIGWEEVLAASGTQSSSTTSTESDGYGWGMMSFVATDATWVLAPETQDEDDATYRAVVITDAFWRVALSEQIAIGTARAFIGFSAAASRTIELEGANEADFSDAVVLDSVTLTSTGAYTGDELAFTVASPAQYQFYRLVADGAYDMRVYTVELYDYVASGGGGEPTADAHIADPTDAHDASAISVADSGGNYTGADVEAVLAELFDIFVTVRGGGKEVVESHGNAGASEVFNLANGNVHTATLDSADCTVTLSGATASKACGMTMILTQDGSGGRLVTWPGSVVWPGGEEPTLSTDPSAIDVITLLTVDGGTTWFGFYGATPISLGDTVESETTFGQTPDAGASSFASRADHTHGTPDEPEGGGGGGTAGFLLLADTGRSSPLVFGDILQADDYSDLLYSEA